MSILDNFYDVEIIKNKLDKTKKDGDYINCFSMEEIINLLDLIEKKTIEIVKEFDYRKIEIVIDGFTNNKSNNLRSQTSIHAYVTKDGLINLDELEIEKSLSRSSKSYISLYELSETMDKEDLEKFKKQYGVSYFDIIPIQNIKK